ncbi:MAG: transcriptional regulator [Coriobacteriales bacterium]|jgi:y4mF family transcriptional regulator|nr:transcriptional regulator [Coriobacteriales bacterium]
MSRLIIKNSKDMGSVIRTRRKTLGLTQRELVDVAPFGITFISDLENGKETAQLNKAIETLKMLGLRLIIEAPDESDVSQQEARP